MSITFNFEQFRWPTTYNFIFYRVSIHSGQKEFLDLDHLLQMGDDLSLTAPRNNSVSGSFVLVT